MPEFVQDAIDETILIITPDVFEEVTRKTREILLYYRSMVQLLPFSSTRQWPQTPSIIRDPRHADGSESESDTPGDRELADRDPASIRGPPSSGVSPFEATPSDQDEVAGIPDELGGRRSVFDESSETPTDLSRLESPDDFPAAGVSPHMPGLGDVSDIEPAFDSMSHIASVSDSPDLLSRHRRTRARSSRPINRALFHGNPAQEAKLSRFLGRKCCKCWKREMCQSLSLAVCGCRCFDGHQRRDGVKRGGRKGPRKTFNWRNQFRIWVLRVRSLDCVCSWRQAKSTAKVCAWLHAR